MYSFTSLTFFCESQSISLKLVCKWKWIPVPFMESAILRSPSHRAQAITEGATQLIMKWGKSKEGTRAGGGGGGGDDGGGGEEEGGGGGGGEEDRSGGSVCGETGMAICSIRCCCCSIAGWGGEVMAAGRRDGLTCMFAGELQSGVLSWLELQQNCLEDHYILR